MLEKPMKSRARCVLFGLMLVGLLNPSGVFARPPAVVPADDGLVVETLPRGFAAIMPTARPVAPSIASVERLLQTAARTGDARLVARAEVELSGLSKGRATPAHLRARAHIAQYRHDFSSALRWLDQAIAADPRAPDARLARAQILLVQGEVRRARAECTTLALTVDTASGLICVAAVALRAGDHDHAISLLDRQLQGGGLPAPLRRHLLVMRAEAASRRGDADAGRWFDRALALVPGDVRTLAAASRHLRESGRARDAYHLLAAAPRTDHLLLEHALAARDIQAPDAPALAAAVAGRLAASRRFGTEPDARDEALYELEIRRRPARALQLARINFTEQRDYEDVMVLARAAKAARDPSAWRPVEQWARAQAVSIPDGISG